MQPELVLDAHANLCEGPAWDASAKRITWVDIHAGDLHIFHPQDRTDECFNLGEPISCAAPCRNGDMFLALRSGLATFHLPSHKLTHLVNLEPHASGNRSNDGKCDPAGRFLVGTMDDAEKEASGSLYSYSPEGRAKTLLTGLRISNGLTWSPDYRTFYHIDTPRRQVSAYDYELTTGDISRPRAVVFVPPKFGWPDGMTSDTEGMLWVAMWAGSKLTRWNPVSGQLLEAIYLPALNVTSCIFGGAELTDLYITTARTGLSAKQIEQYPLSGGLFRLKTKFQGLPSFNFGN